MRGVVRTLFACIIIAALAGFQEAAAQSETLTVNPDLAKRGKSLFTSRGCLACHSIGDGKRAGPDLAGVTDRRELDWLRRYLADPPAMMETDSVAKALLDEYKGVKMPDLNLNETQIDALLHYIKDETMKSSDDNR